MEWYFILLIIIASLLLVLFIFYFICILPGNYKKCKDVNWLYESVIAHRGYYDNDKGILENSERAIRLAIERKYNIETDLSLTKDEQIVMYHDGSFKRLYGIDKKVSELTLEEIKSLKFDKSEDTIITFEELLNIVDDQVGLLLEFKFDFTKNDKILLNKASKILESYKGRFAVQSFNPFMVEYFKKNYPTIPRGQLYMHMKDEGKVGFKKRLVTLVYNLKMTNIVSKPLFINEDTKYFTIKDKFCSLFMKTIVWTVKTDEEYDKFFNKVDNIIIEKLDLNQDGTRKQ